MQDVLEDFFHYLQIERGLAENTIISYKRDLKNYLMFIKEEKIYPIGKMFNDMISYFFYNN